MLFKIFISLVLLPLFMMLGSYMIVWTGDRSLRYYALGLALYILFLYILF